MLRTWLATQSTENAPLGAAATQLGTPSPTVQAADVVLTNYPLAQVLSLAEALRPEQVIIAALDPTERALAWAHLGIDIDDIVAPDVSPREVVARAKLALAGRRDEPDRRVIRRFAHDLNNPLTAVRLLSEMLVADLHDPETKQDLADILEAADVASALVDNLSGFVKTNVRPAATQQRVDLAGIINEVVNRPFLRPHLTVEQPLTPVSVMGDRASLRQAVLELAHTARQMSNPDGDASLRLRLGPVGVSLTFVVRSPRLTDADVSLLHRYSGIDDELRSYQLLPTGMSASAATAQRLGGHLRVESFPHGLELELHLPQVSLG